MKTVTKKEIKTAFTKAGLCAGDTVMVHTSLSRMGYVRGNIAWGMYLYAGFFRGGYCG